MFLCFVVLFLFLFLFFCLFYSNFVLFYVFFLSFFRYPEAALSNLSSPSKKFLLTTANGLSSAANLGGSSSTLASNGAKSTMNTYSDEHSISVSKFFHYFCSFIWNFSKTSSMEKRCFYRNCNFPFSIFFLYFLIARKFIIFLCILISILIIFLSLFFSISGRNQCRRTQS